MNINDATAFVTKLKAHGSPTDFCDLEKANEEFGFVLTKLSIKDKQTFSLNVFCILCRNLEKVTSWREKVNDIHLTKLCIECARQTRGLTGEERVKCLACVYHVHRYVMRQNSSIPPEFVLKLSFMPFECDANQLLKDYHKTYWGIIADRITYMEKLKTKLPIKKLLPKLNEDLAKVIHIYKDIYDFCITLLPFIFKKLFHVFDSPLELNETYRIVFDSIRVHSKTIKECNDKQIMEIYIKFNDCLNIVAENSSKNDFKNCPLDEILRTCLSLLGHHPGMFHCLQTFYLNSFLYLFKKISDEDNVFKNLLVSCETTEKLGYKNLMYATYPFLNQLLRLWIEYYNKSSNIEESCLKFILFSMEKLQKCMQIVKCENCNINTGQHDALRLSFLVKNLINKSLKDNSFAAKANIFNAIIEEQYQILNGLKADACANYVKYTLKLQTDVHNTAILLHKAGIYDFSVKLFDVYLKNEFDNLRNDDFKNISRALYNKSICLIDNKLYEKALQDAYLSLVFAKDLKNEKYMSLVLDIKAKALKNEDENQSNEELQLISVLSICRKVSIYGDLRRYFKNVKFSELLKHEFTMYEKLWPSLVPITGVIQSLRNLIDGTNVKGEDKVLKEIFYDILLETPSVVRSIQHECFKRTVKEILDSMDWEVSTIEDKMIYVALMFIKSEHDIQEASDKYKWKPAEHLIDPDQHQVVRTLSQEREATEQSIRGVELLATCIRDLGSMSPRRLANFLNICEVIVHQLLHMCRTLHALQLSTMCLRLSKFLGDKVSYIRNTGVILYHAERQYAEMDSLSAIAVKLWNDVLKSKDSIETALIFICDVAMYYARCGRKTAAAILVRAAQAHVLNASRVYPDINLELAIGRILEAQVLLCPDTGLAALTSVHTVQRHYLASATSGKFWSPRRRHNLQIKYNISTWTVSCVGLCARMMLYRRAKSAGGAGLGACAARAQAAVYAGIVVGGGEAQIKIDNQLKYILGVQDDLQSTNIDLNKKITPFTPKNSQVETMRDCMARAQLSPSRVFVPAFKVPEFLHHATCSCYACVMPACSILACQTCYLEASNYFHTQEDKIARNYFEGALTMFPLAEEKIKNYFREWKNFEKYIVNIVKDRTFNEFRTVEVEFLIELAFFELSEKQFNKADDCIVRIHEILSEFNIDEYLKHEVSNLLVASALLREKRVDIPKELEIEFDSLKISPANEPKTPESKALPVDTVKIVKNEEVPKKLKVIKLNLDENPEEIDQKPEKPKSKFKIPEPMTSKPSLETITPRPTRSRPNIIVSQETPKNETYLTPKSTPSEAFFTPQTSQKTYTRKIVKNLQSEFSTPTEVTKSLRKKTLLKRATSPGKPDERLGVRTRRVKQPVFEEK